MNNLSKFIYTHCIEVPETLTPYHIINFKLFEFFIVCNAVYLSWYWGLDMRNWSGIITPHGIAHYVDITFLYVNIFPLINASAITVFSILAFLRIKSKWLYAAVFILLLLHFSAIFSGTKLRHDTHFIGVGILSFSLVTFFFKTHKDKYRFIFGFNIFFMGLGYFLSSMSKLIGTGLHWVDGRNLHIWILRKGTEILTDTGLLDFLPMQLLVLDHIALGTLFLVIGLTVEFLAPFFWFRKTRPISTLAILGMHFGIFITLNISFHMNMIQLIIIGLPWPDLLKKYVKSDYKLFQKLGYIPI